MTAALPLALLLQKGAAAGPMARAASPVIVGVALAYFAVVAAISVWAARRTRTAADFFVAGHGIGLVALTVASVSTSVPPGWSKLVSPTTTCTGTGMRP